MNLSKATALAWLRSLVNCLVILMVLPATPSLARIRQPAPTSEAIAALGLSEQSIVVEGVTRWFLVQPPPDVTRPAPVLIVLHGGTQSMRRIFADTAGATRGWLALARRENVLLLVPNGINAATGDAKSDDQNWNDLRHGVARESDADDVGFIRSLLDHASKTYAIDPYRVYVTGA